MYRSFLTCYDPKGVMERGTFWKSRTRSRKVEDKTKSQSTTKNLDKSLTNIPENLDKSQRPMFEVEVPKVRKSNSIIRKVDSKHRKTLKEIFKGLLRKISVKESRLQNHNLSHLHSKQYDEMPRIVLRTPGCTPCQDIDIVDAHVPIPSKDLSLRKLKAEAVPSNVPIPSKDLSLRKLKAEAVPSKTVKHKAGSTKTGKRSEEEIIERCNSQEKGSKDLKVVMKLDEKEVKPIERAPNKGKLYSQVCHKPQLGKTNDKEAKLESIGQNLPEKEISKPRIVAKSQDQGEMTSTEMRKRQSGSRINRSEISCQQSTASNTISNAKAQNNSKDWTENQTKKFTEDEAANPINIDQGEMTYTKMRKSLSGSRINRNEIACQQSTALNTLSKAKAQNNSKDWKKNQMKQQPVAEGEVAKPVNIEQAEMSTNFKVFLDIANEVAERKSLLESQKVQPLLPTCARNSRLQISLGQWVEEISKAIENLKSYSEISGEKLSWNSLYAIMERDMKCNGVINAIWEWGWRHGFSAAEAELVVNEVESLVFSGLIEEILT